MSSLPLLPLPASLPGADPRPGRPAVAWADAEDTGVRPAPEAAEAAEPAGARPRVVLDLSGVGALDRDDVAVLAEARSVAEAAACAFVLADPSAAVLDALAACGGDLLGVVEPAPGPRAVPPRGDVDALVHDNRGLAERLALRFAGRGQPLDDLRQVAYLGLVLAAGRFDPDRGVAFTTFAHATIAGELKRHFRDHAWHLHVARPVQELYLSVRDAAERLTHELGRTPTPGEVASVLGVPEERVVESLEARSALRVDSLDAVRDGDDDPSWRDRAAVEPGYETVEERSWLVPALSALPERERHILKLRFVDGLPQSAIAARVGISQMHVSRLLARSLRTLRAAAGE